MIKEQTYYVKGMHCASCEVLIEKKLLDAPGVVSVQASTSDGKVVIGYEGEKPNLAQVNDIFKRDKYSFFDSSEQARAAKDSNIGGLNPTLLGFVIANFIVIVFLLLDRIGVSGVLNISSASSLLGFFGFGLLAGLSSCAALVGGLVLSMAKHWQATYARESSTKQFLPHVLFNTGRVLSYGFFGGLLGLIGSRLQLSLGIASFLVVAVSFFMMALGLQMLQVKPFQKFRFALPGFITRAIVNEHSFNGRYMPFVLGSTTFFLPCGFTITVQSLALLSGSYIQGALMMAAFALGTAPMLLAIGVSSVKFLEKPHLALAFSKVAGFLLIFFALFNISTQMSVLGITIPSFGAASSQSQSGLAPMVDGKQVLTMTVYAANYSPNYFKVKAGIPVRWEITSSGQPSCDSGAVVARGFLPETLYLNPNAGQVTTTEFTPQKAGTYIFSCTMGMIRGTIEVVE